MIPVIAIRPEPGCSATVEAARALGLAAHGWPLFAIQPVAWQAPAEPFDGILAGSANAFRHGGSALNALRHLPVHAVGMVTAQAAEAAGFAVAQVGAGGLQALVDGLAGHTLHLLRLAGADRVALSLPVHVTQVERVVYASRALPSPAALTALLQDPAVVLLHSARAAAHFAAVCNDHGVARAPLRLATIGPRAAAAAGAGWGKVASAASPDDAALLALARRLCQ